MKDQFEKATTAGICYECGGRIFVGDLIKVTQVPAGVPVAVHKECTESIQGEQK